MDHRFQYPLFSEYWSTLRFPSSGWVTEMLTEKLALNAAYDAITERHKMENKRIDGFITAYEQSKH